jgi:hypothetical protein
MAIKADCGVSTVLEELRVARIAKPLVPTARRLGSPVVVLVAQASRLHVQPGRLHHKAHRIGLSLRCKRLACGTANPKFEIRNPCRHSEFRIRTRCIAGRSRKLVRYAD